MLTQICTHEAPAASGLQASISVHRMSFVPFRLATRSLLGQNIRIKRFPAMMQNVVSAGTSAAPHFTPTPEPMKVQSPFSTNVSAQQAVANRSRETIQEE